MATDATSSAQQADRHTCACRWSSCEMWRERISASALEPDDVWGGGLIQVCVSGQKTTQLVNTFTRHIGTSASIKRRYHIAPYHWNRDLLKRNKDIGRKLSTPISEAEASLYGMNHRSDRYNPDSNKNNERSGVLFLPVPNNTEKSIRDYLAQVEQPAASLVDRQSRFKERDQLRLEEEQKARRTDKQEAQLVRLLEEEKVRFQEEEEVRLCREEEARLCEEHEARLLKEREARLEAHVARLLLATDPFPPSFLPLNSTLCLGITHPAIAKFAEQNPNAAGGVLLQYWDHCRGAYRARNCQLIMNGEDCRCRSCDHEYLRIRKDRHPFLFDVALPPATRNAQTSAGKQGMSSSSLGFTSRSDPSSKHRYDLLSPDSKKKRYSLLRRQEQNKAKHVGRLKEKINAPSNLEYLDVADVKTRELLKSVCSGIKGRHSDVLTEIVAALIKQKINFVDDEQRTMSSQVHAHKCKEVATFFMEEIDKLGHALSETSKQIRFSPRIMRVALSLWLRSPATYNEFKESGLIILPSTRTLESLKSRMRVSEGVCPKVYGWMLDVLDFFKVHRGVERFNQDGFFCVGHLICDELMLKNDTAWNTSDKSMVGLTSDLDLANELKSLMEDIHLADHDHKYCKPVKYVNQWRVRSIYGKSHNCEFFFNAGSLVGDEMLFQFHHIVNSLEFIGCRIVGFCSDSGGNNARLFKLLREGVQLLGRDGWLDAKCVASLNPVDPMRMIAQYGCSSHNIKSSRNALYKSKVGGTRHFRIRGIHFGWEVVEDAYKRDRQRENKDTTLRADAVDPDKWNIMSVSLALSPFSYKTLTELMIHVSKLLDCEELLIATAADLTTKHPVPVKEVYNQRLRLLFHKAQARPTDFSIQRTLACLEYCVHIGSIYNATFQKKRMKLTLANIDEVEAEMRHNLKYFDGWRMEQLESHRNSPKKSDWTKEFMAITTWDNLQLGIRGFFEYARIVLNMDSDYAPFYVPIIHANQSTLEAFFSKVRAMEKDTASKYEASVGMMDWSKTAMFLKNNKMYRKSDVGESIDADDMELTRMENMLGRTDDVRASWLRELLDSRKADTSLESEPIRAFLEFQQISAANQQNPCRLWTTGGSQAVRLVNRILMATTVLKPFCDLSLEDKNFLEYAKLSMNTPRQDWFEALVGLNQSGKMMFDHVCQQILSSIHGCMAKCFTRKAPRGSVDISFYMQLKRFQSSHDFSQTIKNCMPQRMCEDRPSSCILLTEFLVPMYLTWFREAIATIGASRYLVTVFDEEDTEAEYSNLTEDPVKQPEIQERNRNEETKKSVTRFLGWAVQNLQQQWSVRAGKSISSDVTNEVDADSVVKLLEEMSYTHVQALLDDDYMRQCYSTTDSIMNRGHLTLISPQYYQFGESLLTELRKFDSSFIRKHGNNSVGMRFEDLKGNADLRLLFLDCAKNTLSGANRRSILLVYGKLLSKTFNAFTGRVTSEFREDTIGRKVAAASNSSLRGDLKALTKKRKTK